MLMDHGEFVLADNVPANEFLNLEGQKLSTSRNWAVWLHEYLADFAGRQDELRYVLTSIAPETKDSEFTWKDFQTRVNSELVGIFGNLVNRVLVLTDKYFDNVVPAAQENRELGLFITEQQNKITDALENFRFREGLTELINLARHGNQLLSEKEPWKTIKTDKELTAATLYDCLQIITNLAILCEPFLPFTSAKIFEMLRIAPDSLSWESAGRLDLVKTGHQLGTASLLYQKIEDEQIEKQVEKLHNTALSQTLKTNTKKVDNNAPAPASETQDGKTEISIDDFTKIDLRVGTILTAEKVEKADKLLKLSVDMGTEIRTIVSGIAAHFTVEELPGTQVSVVANLAPRKLRGIESKGMILLAEDADGKLHFVSPKDLTQNGSIIR
jgi:methionyl-tRNA synthetase